MRTVERNEAYVLEQGINRTNENYAVFEGLKKLAGRLLFLLRAAFKRLPEGHHMNDARMVVFFHPGTEPIRLCQLSHEKRNGCHRGAVLFLHEELILLDGNRRGWQPPIKQCQLQRHRQVGVVRGFCKKRDVADIIANRIDQADMPPCGADDWEGGQFRSFVLGSGISFLKEKRKVSLRAECGRCNDIFIFVNRFAESLATDLRFFATQCRNARHREHKIHPCGLDPAVLEERVQRNRKILAVPWKIPELADRLGIDIHIANLHGSIHRPAHLDPGIDRLVFKWSQKSIRPEKILSRRKRRERNLRKQSPKAAKN